MMIVGVVGQIASGKGVLVDYLVKKYGFISFSLSTIVHEEVKKRGIKKIERKTLQDVGDGLRKKYGNDVLAKRAVEKLKVISSQLRGKNRFIIEGIRNPAEVEYFKKISYFVLIGIRAKRRLRFERILKRGKPWDPKTWDEFLKIDRRDYGINQEDSGQQVGECIKMADYILTNNKDLESFYKKIEKLIKKSKIKTQISKCHIKI